MSTPSQRARQREHRANTRHEILVAAESFLREQPYRELSVEILMAQTGLGRTAFYRHFDDLTEVVMRLLGETGQQLYAVAERWQRNVGADYPTTAREALAGIVDFFVAHGPLIRAIAEAAVTDDEIERGYSAFLDAFIEMTRQALEHLVAAGQIDIPDPLGMARALNLMNEAYLLREFGREPVGDREIALATLETVWLRAVGPSLVSGSPVRRG
jgi:TetR/AcrR family transcriptional regulator, ethionamide resistance regulator